MVNDYFQNFELAFEKLEDFSNSFDGSEIHAAGIIQAFEFTFEQCWKALQKKAGSEGLSLSSPKKCFEWAMSSGLIDAVDESNWLLMLADRNLTSHTYREAMAEKVRLNIFSVHKKSFSMLLNRMKKIP
jgi:nucleotidyltransferase substrate binding protein (TIGR01987 family)